MNYKEEIQKTLKALKQLGFQRPDIEKRLGLAEGSISQTIARNGSERLLKALVLYKEWAILSKSVNEEFESVVQEPEPAYEQPALRLIEQQNKLIDSMNRQSKTANSILERLANNVESRVEVIDTNLTDALGRIESLKLDLRSGRNVVLKSLARLEKRAESSLVKEADSIILALMQEQSRKQNKKPGKGS